MSFETDNYRILKKKPKKRASSLILSPTPKIPARIPKIPNLVSGEVRLRIYSKSSSPLTTFNKIPQAYEELGGQLFKN